MSPTVDGLLVIGMGPEAKVTDALEIEQALRDRGIEALIIANCTALVVVPKS